MHASSLKCNTFFAHLNKWKISTLNDFCIFIMTMMDIKIRIKYFLMQKSALQLLEINFLSHCRHFNGKSSVKSLSVCLGCQKLHNSSRDQEQFFVTSKLLNTRCDS
jgi:hypothetical protein